MSELSLRTSDSALIARLGGAEYARCVALALTPVDMANLADLGEMYEQSPGALIPLIESGLSLNRVNQALEAQQNHFPEESTKTVAQLLILLGLNRAVQLSDTNSGGEDGEGARIAEPMGTEEARERDLLRSLGLEPEEAPTTRARAHRYQTDTTTAAQSDMMDTFADALSDAGGIGLPRLIKLIRSDLDGDSLRGYHIALDRPDAFRRFLRGEISVDALLRLDSDNSQYLANRSPADVFTGF